jgi:hypothetical protein
MSGAIHPLPQYAFMAWCSDKAKPAYFALFYFCTGVKFDLFKLRKQREVHGVSNW